MKKVIVVIALVALISVATAKSIRPSKRGLIEIAPRMSLYLNDYKSGNAGFSMAGDIVFSPLKEIGFRIGITELHLNGGSTFELNQGYFNLLPKIEALIYMPMRELDSYIHMGFGLVTGEGATYLSLGGGMGVNFYLARGIPFFAEPGIFILNFPEVGGGSHTMAMFRLSFGAKFYVLR